MNSIRFTSREAFVEALESRRAFWRKYDERQEKQHKAAEQKWLTDARAKLRDCLKMDYTALSKQARHYAFGLRDQPRCPVLQEPKIDVVLASLKLTQGKTFIVDSNGTWGDAHSLLTWNPDAKKTVC